MRITAEISRVVEVKFTTRVLKEGLRMRCAQRLTSKSMENLLVIRVGGKFPRLGLTAYEMSPIKALDEFDGTKGVGVGDTEAA